MPDRLTQEQHDEIRARDAEGVQFKAVQDRAALLAHIEASEKELNRYHAAVADENVARLKAEEKLAQAEAALREANEGNANWKQLWNRVVEAAGAQHVSVLSQVIKRIAHQRATVAQQAERIAQLETAATNAVVLIRERYNEHRDPKSYDSDWGQAEDRKCNWCVDADAVFAALAASSAEPPTPNCLSCGMSRLVGFTIGRKPGPFCADCWIALKQHVADAGEWTAMVGSSASSFSASGAQDEKEYLWRV